MRTSRLIPVLVLLLSVHCSSFKRIQRRSTIMDFLYPSQATAPTPDPTRAVLQLPLRIGVAFVPPVETATGWLAPSLDTTSEKELLEVVRRAFQEKDWVGDIQIIPTTYLNSEGGFDNLDQVARMFRTDVVVLTGFDQVQYNDPQLLSIAYLSIVGAYVLPGDRNDTRTLIEAAAFHVPSRTFLLRAPGRSHLKGTSTLNEQGEVLREKSDRGFRLAMTDLAKNLETEVDSFKQQIVSGEREDVKVVTAEGKTMRGGGSLGLVFAAAALAGALILRQTK